MVDDPTNTIAPLGGGARRSAASNAAISASHLSLPGLLGADAAGGLAITRETATIPIATSSNADQLDLMPGSPAPSRRTKGIPASGSRPSWLMALQCITATDL